MKKMIAVVLVFWVAASPLPAGSQEGDPLLKLDQELQEVASSRSVAVSAKDKAAFLKTVDTTSAAYRAKQGEWFDALTALPIRDYSLTVDLDLYGSQARDRDRKRYGAPVVITTVEQRFHFEGYQEKPAVSELNVTFVKRDDGWLFASESDLDDLGFYSERHPWDFGPVQVFTSDHFIMLSHPEHADFAAELLPLAESALPRVEQLWLKPWGKKIPIIVPSTRQELEQVLATTIDVSKFVAFAVSGVDSEEKWEAAPRFIIINRDRFSARDADIKMSIFSHELLHIANSEYSGPFTPIWVEEGFARLAETQRPGDIQFFQRWVRAGRFDGKVPDDLEFISGSANEIFAAYQESFSAIAFLQKKVGTEKLNDFYIKLGAARDEPGMMRYHLDQSMRELFGMSFLDFENEWASAARAGNA